MVMELLFCYELVLFIVSYFCLFSFITFWVFFPSNYKAIKEFGKEKQPDVTASSYIPHWK